MHLSPKSLIQIRTKCSLITWYYQFNIHCRIVSIITMNGRMPIINVTTLPIKVPFSNRQLSIAHIGIQN